MDCLCRPPAVMPDATRFLPCLPSGKTAPIMTTSRRNALSHAVDGVFFHAGLVVLSRQVTMPKLVTELTDSALLVGLIPVVWTVGLFLPQAFHAKRVEGLAYKKHTVLLCGVVQRIGWVIFLVSLFVAWGGAFTLGFFFFALALASVGTGLAIPVWTDWFAKTTADGAWGKVLGIRRAMSGVLGIVIGHFLIRWVMATYPAPERYQILVGVAVGCFVVSYAAVLMVQEEARHGLPNHRESSWREYAGHLVRILSRRGGFRRFLVALLLVNIPIVLMMAFLTKYGLTYEGVGEEVTGSFTLFFFGASAVGSLVGGFLSDRRGVLAPMRMLPLFPVAGAAAAVVSAHPALVCTAFAMVGLAFGTRVTCMLPAIFRFAGPEQRPSYMAVAFTCMGLANMAIPPAVGALVDVRVLSFPVAFFACGVMSLVGWVLFLKVPVPRGRRPAGE